MSGEADPATTHFRLQLLQSFRANVHIVLRLFQMFGESRLAATN